MWQLHKFQMLLVRWTGWREWAEKYRTWTWHSCPCTLGGWGHQLTYLNTPYPVIKPCHRDLFIPVLWLCFLPVFPCDFKGATDSSWHLSFQVKNSSQGEFFLSKYLTRNSGIRQALRACYSQTNHCGWVGGMPWSPGLGPIPAASLWSSSMLLREISRCQKVGQQTLSTQKTPQCPLKRLVTNEVQIPIIPYAI